MDRKREHRRHLNRILRNDKMNPNRALLPIMLGMLLDSKDKEADVMTDLLTTTFGSTKKIRWTDEDDPALGPPGDQVEQEQTKRVASIFSDLMRRSEKE